MTIVVDASIAFKWFVPEPGGEAALALLDSDEALIAPDLIHVELGNAMWVRLRTLADGLAATMRAQRELTRILSQLESSAALMPRAIEIGFEIGHPIHDCIYLALCEQHDAPLVTADRRLASATARTGFMRRIRLVGADD